MVKPLEQAIHGDFNPTFCCPNCTVPTVTRAFVSVISSGVLCICSCSLPLVRNVAPLVHWAIQCIDDKGVGSGDQLNDSFWCHFSLNTICFPLQLHIYFKGKPRRRSDGHERVRQRIDKHGSHKRSILFGCVPWLRDDGERSRD